MTKKSLADRILDTALQLADVSSWEAVHLYDVATELDITLEQLAQCYAQKDDLVEAWYDRADRAMLARAEEAEFLQLDMPQRLHALIMQWLDSLALHKRVSRDMLCYKLEPGHIHLQLLGILRISRTVQWLREAARQESNNLQRIIDEIGLTSIYLMTFVYWIGDVSPNQEKTRRFLEKKLQRAEQLQRFLPFRAAAQQ